jgi:hypothetical protein
MEAKQRCRVTEPKGHFTETTELFISHSLKKAKKIIHDQTSLA